VSELIVAVDGPSGTGKSTVSRAVARHRGLPHLDTGAFYRAATLAVLRSGVSPGDAQAAAAVVAAAEMDQIEGRMFLDAEDVTEEIRSSEVTQTVSQVSAHPAVRKLLVDHQRRWVERHGGRAVVEGRDIGSVVFPDATVKIYLDARPEVRAQRRALETGESPEEVLKDIRRRDEYDSTRSASPLTVPKGAVIVDTSDLSFDEVVESVLALLPADS
jgi:cytidylate kinase